MTELVRLWEEDGIGFVVYACQLKFREGATHGETIEIRTTVSKGSAFRAVFTQEVWQPDGVRPMVEGTVDLCCVDRAGKLVRLPDSVVSHITALLAGPESGGPRA